MWDLIASVLDHCLSFYFVDIVMLFPAHARAHSSKVSNIQYIFFHVIE